MSDVTQPPKIGRLPEAPNRQSARPDFAVKADDFVAAQDPWGQQVNVLADWMEGIGLLVMQYAQEGEQWNTATEIAKDKAEASAASALASKEAAALSANVAKNAEDAAIIASSNAQAASANAEVSATEASASEELAKRWATNPEDEVVEEGLYSAKHWALKASQIVGNANDVITRDTPEIKFSGTGRPLSPLQATIGSVDVSKVEGLGTAATRDVGEASGNLMEVGAFGVGRYRDLRSEGWVYGTPSDYYGKGFWSGLVVGSDLGIGSGVNYGTLIVRGSYIDASGGQAISRTFIGGYDDGVYVSFQINADTWSPWRAITHSGNLLQSTGSSIEYPMSQKAVTDEFGKLKEGARRDVVSSPTDTSGGNKLVTQGWMGLGNGRINNDNSTATKLAYFGETTVPTGWTGYGYGTVITHFHGYHGDCTDIVIAHTSSDDNFAVRNSRENDWLYVTHSGNIKQGTGNSTRYPMSQKAVTDTLNTKANISNPGSMGIGVGQTWQDVAWSRSSETTYTNTTGRPIMVAVGAEGQDARVVIYVNGVMVAYTQDTYSGPFPSSSASAIVPSGATYKVESRNNNGVSIRFWAELR